MIDADFAARFATDWIAAWNRHDLDALLDRCADDIEWISPLLPRLARARSGVLRGKRAIGACWARQLTAPALTLAPRLRCTALRTLSGQDSLVLLSCAGPRTIAQTFGFRADGRVARLATHHAN
jgi:hypothetical protein